VAVVRSPAAVVGKRAASSAAVVVGILGPEAGNAVADAVVDVVVVAVAETCGFVPRACACSLPGCLGARDVACSLPDQLIC